MKPLRPLLAAAAWALVSTLPVVAQSTLSLEITHRGAMGLVEGEVPVHDFLESFRLRTEGEAGPVHCVGAFFDGGEPVRAWSSYPTSTSRAAGSCVGASPLFLGDFLEPGDRVFPGDMFYGAEEFAPAEISFPGDMFFPAEALFPGDMLRRMVLRHFDAGPGVVLFMISEDEAERSRQAILPILIRFEER